MLQDMKFSTGSLVEHYTTLTFLCRLHSTRHGTKILLARANLWNLHVEHYCNVDSSDIIQSLSASIAYCE